MSNTRKGIILALLTVGLWSTLGVGLKLAVSRVGGFTAVVWIIGVSAVALFVYLIAVGKAGRIWPALRGQPVFFIGTGLAGFGLHQVLYLHGYQLLPASQVIIIHYLWPLTMVVLAVLVYRERTTRISLLFVATGFIGLYIALAKGTLLQLDLSAGVVITFTGSFFWALFSVLIKHRDFDIDVGMFLFNLFGLLFLIAMIPAFEFTLDVTAKEIVGFAYLGVFPTAISYILWNHALRLARTSLCSNIVLLMPVLSLIWIRLILAEEITVYQLTGFALILGSVFLNLRYGGVEGVGAVREPPL